MNLPLPQQFAKALRLSVIPKEAKEIILEKLPTLSNEQIVAIYEMLVKWQDKIHKITTEFDSKIKFAELKFDQELSNLKSKAQL